MSPELPGFTGVVSQLVLGIPHLCCGEGCHYGRPPHLPHIKMEPQLSPVGAMCFIYSVVSLALKFVFLPVPQKIESTNDFIKVL